MAAFTTPDAVRLKLLITDHALITTEAISQSITEAHAQLLPLLREEVDTASPSETLSAGETLLAVARLLRSLALHDAAACEDLQIGGQKILRGKAFPSLTALADQLEKHAWETLADCLETFPRPPLLTTDPQPLFPNA